MSLIIHIYLVQLHYDQSFFMMQPYFFSDHAFTNILQQKNKMCTAEMLTPSEIVLSHSLSVANKQSVFWHLIFSRLVFYVIVLLLSL